MDTLRFHTTRENFYGVSCNQVESKIRTGDLVHSARCSLWQHAGKREGSVSGSSEGGTHCSASQVSDRAPTYSQGRRMSVPKQGGTQLTLTRGMWVTPLCCCSSAHVLQESLQEVMVVSAGRWAENGNLHFMLHGSQQPAGFLPLWSCWVAKEEQTVGSPADCSRPNPFAANSPSSLLEGSRTGSMEDFLQQGVERVCSKLWLFSTINLFLCVITIPHSILILT